MTSVWPSPFSYQKVVSALDKFNLSLSQICKKLTIVSKICWCPCSHLFYQHGDCYLKFSLMSLFTEGCFFRCKPDHSSWREVFINLSKYITYIHRSFDPYLAGCVLCCVLCCELCCVLCCVLCAVLCAVCCAVLCAVSCDVLCCLLDGSQHEQMMARVRHEEAVQQQQQQAKVAVLCAQTAHSTHLLYTPHSIHTRHTAHRCSDDFGQSAHCTHTAHSTHTA
jgi:hypothetical protein